VEPITADLDAIIKAYDVRGLVPEQVNPALARAVGAAFVRVIDAHGQTIVVGEDMRPSSPELARAFADGANSQGADVILIGLASTDMLYFASGHLNAPGAMFTASHNPAQYNGIKLCRAGAAPVGQESGLREIKAMIAAGVPDWDGPRGSVSERALLEEYAEHVLSLVPHDGMRRLKVVVDAGNGMGGHTAPAVFARMDVDLVPMYFELDGTFPNHEANPIEPANVRDLQARVISERADIGLAFDGDADRCFVIDELGAIVSPSALTALIAVRELQRVPGSTIIHNLITSKSVPEIVREHGGTPDRTRVGHSFIKARMAETGAIFGGEHSGHFYFKDFWRADSGMLAALHAIAALGTSGGATLSEIMSDYERYPMSGEINSTVDDQVGRLAAIREHFAGHDIDELDGLTVSAADWWFNVRPSNTEPLLRLNVEADDRATMERVRDQVLGVIRG
jgi:phosphomannomutase